MAIASFYLMLSIGLADLIPLCAHGDPRRQSREQLQCVCLSTSRITHKSGVSGEASECAACH
jgi:hypothetical protein